MITVEGHKIAGLYLFLKEHENLLDKNMQDLHDDIETYLYDILSIEEMENIKSLYENNSDFLIKK